MRVEFGNANPVGRHDDAQRRPVITYLNVPDSYTFKRDVDAEDWRSHLTKAVMRNNGITNYEGGEVLNQLTHPGGPWPSHGANDPTWVWSDDTDAARFCSEYYQVPVVGTPEGGHGDLVDETHWRRFGKKLLEPGVPAGAVSGDDLTGLLTNVGTTIAAQVIGGNAVGATGHGSAATATTLTVTGLSTNAWVGAVVYATDTTNNQIVWGNVISNTTTAFTVDQWYNVGTPGGAAATTPAAGFYWLVTFAVQPSWFMGITTTNITPAATDTSLSGEATTQGMARKITAYTVTSAAAASSITWTNSVTFTFTGSSATTFFALGLFDSNVKADTTDTMFWETSFSGSFTVTNNGDQATVTDTITSS